jgi:hypothetical protein
MSEPYHGDTVTLAGGTEHNVTVSDWPPAAAPKPEQPGVMAGAADGDTQQPPFDATLAGGDALGRLASCEVDVAASTISDGTHRATEHNVTASDGPPAAMPEQSGVMTGAADGDTQQPQFAAMVRKPPKKPRASTPRDKVALAWIRRVAKSVFEIEHSPEWPPRSDAANLPTRLELVREALARLTAKAPRDLGLVFPGAPAQQLNTLLSEVLTAIVERSATQDGETCFWGEWKVGARDHVLEALSKFADKHEAAVPDFIETFSPVQDATVGVEFTLANVARELHRYLQTPKAT